MQKEEEEHKEFVLLGSSHKNQFRRIGWWSAFILSLSLSLSRPKFLLLKEYKKQQHHNKTSFFDSSHVFQSIGCDTLHHWDGGGGKVLFIYTYLFQCHLLAIVYMFLCILLFVCVCLVCMCVCLTVFSVCDCISQQQPRKRRFYVCWSFFFFRRLTEYIRTWPFVGVGKSR